jgi:hypothetical protein
MRQGDGLQLEPYVYFLHVLTELSQHAPNANASKLLPFNFAKLPARARSPA